MAASLREYRARIRATQATKKITRAMELIAASRIIKAQQRAAAATPFARELTRAISALATYSRVDHPLTTEPENPQRAGILLITSDRGLAGPYSSAVIKEAERLTEKLHAEGKEVSLFVTGHKGIGYYHFRRRPVVQSWQGFSDNPAYDDARAIADTVIATYMAGHTDEEKSDRDSDDETDATPVEPIDELHVVFTRFRSMLVQQPDVIRMMPLEVVEAEEEPEEEEVLPLYEFEPSPEDVLDALLPRYVESRLFFCLMQAAASELAARQRAMKSATDNAQDLIEKYTRVANQARQAGITQEISEIVGSANALADASAGSE